MSIHTTPEPYERIPLTPQGEAYRAATIERNMARAERFASDPTATPSALRRPYTKHRFNRLSPEVRLAVIRDNVTARVDDEQQKFLRRIAAQRAAEREAAAAAAAAAAAEREAEADRAPAATPSPYVVPCAGGCGALLPARSAKPVVKFCTPHRAQEARSKRPTRSPLEATIREAFSGEGPRRSGASTSRPNKGRKSRRRAVCAGL